MLNAGVLIGQKLDFAKLMVKLQKQKHLISVIVQHFKPLFSIQPSSEQV
jgi:hypothetical protein